jgi:2'-5' RNA ligase
VKSGIIILATLTGAVRDRVREVQQRYDPKLASLVTPHLTITGSSGMGPISTRTSVDELRARLEPITSTTPPMSLPLGPPERFPQTNVIALPLDPHGPLRVLHDRIKGSGLLYEQPRFPFTPHITLSLFPELAPAKLRKLLAVRITEPVQIAAIECWQTLDIIETTRLLELPLTGAPTGA